jgi:hypothetical protein
MATAQVGDVVAVTWLDAWVDQGESSEHEWNDDCEVTTYGILVRRTSRVVSVAAETMPDTDVYRGVTHIPRKMVVKGVRRITSGAKK